jgi:hypothetical protein
MDTTEDGKGAASKESANGTLSALTFDQALDTVTLSAAPLESLEKVDKARSYTVVIHYKHLCSSSAKTYRKVPGSLLAIYADWLAYHHVCSFRSALAIGIQHPPTHAMVEKAFAAYESNDAGEQKDSGDSLFVGTILSLVGGFDL